jgi:hypothetical protein
MLTPRGSGGVGGRTVRLASPRPWPLREVDFLSIQDELRCSPDFPEGYSLTLIACQPLAEEATHD